MNTIRAPTIDFSDLASHFVVPATVLGSFCFEIAHGERVSWDKPGEEVSVWRYESARGSDVESGAGDDKAGRQLTLYLSGQWVRM